MAIEDHVELFNVEDIRGIEEKIAETDKNLSRLSKTKRKENSKIQKLKDIKGEFHDVREHVDKLTSKEDIWRSLEYRSDNPKIIRPTRMDVLKSLRENHMAEERGFLTGMSLAAIGSPFIIGETTILGLAGFGAIAYGYLGKKRGKVTAYQSTHKNKIVIPKMNRYDSLTVLAHEYCHHVQFPVYHMTLNTRVDNVIHSAREDNLSRERTGQDIIASKELDAKVKEELSIVDKKFSRLAEGHAFNIEWQIGKKYSEKEDDEGFLRSVELKRLGALYTAWQMVKKRYNIQGSPSLESVCSSYSDEVNYMDGMHAEGYAYYDVKGLGAKGLYDVAVPLAQGHDLGLMLLKSAG